MLGRNGMLIHGDSRLAPGTASQGCIILDSASRSRIADHGGGTLTVTP
jgi:hypothetical protein